MSLKQYFVICCMIVLVIMLVSLRILLKRKEPIKKVMGRMILVTCLSVFVTMLELLTNDRELMMLGRCMFYACMDWVCFSLLRYVSEYTEQRKDFPYILPLWLTVLGLDSLSMLLNPFLGHAAQFEMLVHEGENFLVVRPLFLYEVHLGICYFLIVDSFVRLLIACLRAPSIYRMKYICVPVAVFVTVLVDAIYLLTDNYFDISIVFFAISFVVVMYFTFYYAPRLLRKQIQMLVVEEMKDIVINFDDKDKCVYFNRMPQEIKVPADMGLQAVKDFLRERTNNSNIVEINLEDGLHYFNQSSSELKDKKGRYIGCFYVLHDVTDEQKMLREQYYLANFDSLTGLYNRNHFIEKATDFMKADPKQRYILICSNIRHFKALNDMFGERIGDNVLQSIAEGLRKDDDHDRVYGRIGGDSFAICMPEDHFHVDAYLRKSRQVFQLPYLQYPVVNHTGIYRVENVNLSVSVMCDRAMLAIASIRNDYQQEVIYYDEKLRDKLLHEQEILKDVKAAFEEGQFVIYLQPQMNHRTRTVIGAEALVRWNHPEKGLIPPAQFIPVLEKYGMVTQLDRHVWELACKQLSKWRKEGNYLPISVNISGKDFFYTDLYDTFTGLIKKYDIPAECLRLEITETTFAMDLKQQLDMIERLREAGFFIEMDDFGSGYSSLNTLKNMPIDVLKMDMAFMSETDKYKRGPDILQMVVAMADRLAMPVIAEGVETKEQADFLVAIGCDVIQGYYYAKPMSVAELEKFIEQNEADKVYDKIG